MRSGPGNFNRYSACVGRSIRPLRITHISGIGCSDGDGCLPNVFSTIANVALLMENKIDQVLGVVNTIGGGGVCCGEMSVFIRCFDRMHVRGRQYVNCTSNLSLLCTENKLVEFIFPLVPVQLEILYTFCYLEA